MGHRDAGGEAVEHEPPGARAEHVDERADERLVLVLRVDRAGQLALDAVERGEQVLDRMEVPGVGQLSYFKDTEGNIFGALQPVSG